MKIRAFKIIIAKLKNSLGELHTVWNVFTIRVRNNVAGRGQLCIQFAVQDEVIVTYYM